MGRSSKGSKGDPYALLSLANNNEIDQALSHVYDALCIHPANKDALSMQGNMYLQQGDVRMAQGKYIKSERAAREWSTVVIVEWKHCSYRHSDFY